MPFEKGKSGNPGGRPKVEGEIRALAQTHGPAAIAKLVEHMVGEDDRLAQTAATALLDRGFGKPHQSSSLEGPDGGPVQLQEIARTFIDPKTTDTDS